MTNTIREDDGFDRPMMVPVSTYRPRVKYTDMGRVIAGGRVVRVSAADAAGPTFLGRLYVSDEGRIYASPDTLPESGDVMAAYAQLRWVGGHNTRQEAVAYLRAHRDAASAWWAEAARDRGTDDRPTGHEDCRCVWSASGRRTTAAPACI